MLNISFSYNIILTEAPFPQFFYCFMFLFDLFNDHYVGFCNWYLEVEVEMVFNLQLTAWQISTKLLEQKVNKATYLIFYEKSNKASFKVHSVDFCCQQICIITSMCYFYCEVFMPSSGSTIFNNCSFCWPSEHKVLADAGCIKFAKNGCWGVLDFCCNYSVHVLASLQVDGNWGCCHTLMLTLTVIH